MKTIKYHIEHWTYLMGGIGAVCLLIGVVLVVLCKCEHPCPHEYWLKLSYFFGHSFLLISALMFCFLPGGKRNQDKET